MNRVGQGGRYIGGIKLAIVLLMVMSMANGLLASDIRLPKVKKKLILSGWEFVLSNPQNMKDIVETVSGRGVDGVVMGFAVPTDREGIYCSRTTAMNGFMWKKEWFSDDIKAMKAAKSNLLTENFLESRISPFEKGNRKQLRLPWNDDEQWKCVANNLAVLAYAAKQGGFRGLVLDPEDYARAQQYILQPSDGDYESAYRLARLRGKQVMASIAKEYPDITILFYWLLSANPRFCLSDPWASMKCAGDLWVPFVNGMLDALPPSARLIDGTEAGYGFHGTDFAEAANMIRNSCLNLVEPENRAKYSRQVEVGFGVYADAHKSTENTADSQVPPPKTKLLMKDLSDALVAADTYVWLWGEHGCWKTWNPDIKLKPWEEIVPGYEAAIQLAKDMDGSGRRMLEELIAKGEAKNLVSNPGFEESGKSPTTPAEYEWSGVTPGWSTWQWAPGKGIYSVDAEGGISGGAALAAGPTDGCFIQTLPVNPGDVYAVGASSRLNGTGRITLQVRWKDKDGKWLREYEERYAYYPQGHSGWQDARQIVCVPDAAANLILLLWADLPGAQDKCQFDNIEVYKLF